jgi:hypothetical protein
MKSARKCKYLLQPSRSPIELYRLFHWRDNYFLNLNLPGMEMRPIAAALLLGSVLFATAAQADVVFTDSTFPSANYSQGFVYSAGAGNTATFSQCASCGNPGSGLQSVFTTSPDGGTFNTPADFIGIMNTTFLYNPGSGPVSSIDVSIDKDLSANLANTYGNTFRFLIEQDGNFYQDGISGPALAGSGSTGFNTISGTDLVAADFTLIDTATATLVAGSNPNFDGDPITFGIGQYLSSTGLLNDNPTVTYDYDNFDVTVHTAVTAVPEPITLSLFGAGLAGAIAMRRRRKKAA